MQPLPKETIKKLAAAGYCTESIAASIQWDVKHLAEQIKAEPAFARLLDKLVMDYYLARQHEQRRKN